MNTTTIGWIGLGNMGRPMSQQLQKAGYSVTAYNRSTTPDITPAAVLKASDLIFIMVSDDNATRDVFTSNAGLLSTKETNKLIINMSTVSPGVSKEMAAMCEQQGNHYLDAPVSGSVRQAEEGQLVIMVGGTTAAFERALPILQQLGKLVLRIGDTGAGNTAKLAINLLLGLYAQGLAEAALFAQAHGVRTADFLQVFNNSALGNVFGRIKGDAILHENYKAAFALKLIAKDLRLARAEGWKTPLAETTFQTFREAEPQYGDLDIIAIIKQLAAH
jgi:3-hydroxyisobutyrate dehydrogenase